MLIHVGRQWCSTIRKVNNAHHPDQLDSKEFRNIVGHNYLLYGEEYQVLLNSHTHLGITAFDFKIPLGH